jgi:hypothetical protein
MYSGCTFTAGQVALLLHSPSTFPASWPAHLSADHAPDCQLSELYGLMHLDSYRTRYRGPTRSDARAQLLREHTVDIDKANPTGPAAVTSQRERSRVGSVVMPALVWAWPPEMLLPSRT